MRARGSQGDGARGQEKAKLAIWHILICSVAQNGSGQGQGQKPGARPDPSWSTSFKGDKGETAIWPLQASQVAYKGLTPYKALKGLIRRPYKAIQGLL